MRRKETSKERLQSLFKNSAAESAREQNVGADLTEELGRFDNYLNELVQSGEVNFPLNDDLIDIVKEATLPEPLDASMRTRLSETIRKAFDERRRQAEPTITFGSYLKRARIQRGIEERKLARQIGIATSFLVEIESDVASPFRLNTESFVRLCRVLALKGRKVVELMCESRTGVQEISYRGIPLTREDRGSTLSEHIEGSKAAKEAITSFAETQATREKLLSELEKTLKEAGLW